MAQWDPCGPYTNQGDQLAQSRQEQHQYQQHDQLTAASDGQAGCSTIQESPLFFKMEHWDLNPWSRIRTSSSQSSPCPSDRNMKKGAPNPSQLQSSPPRRRRLARQHKAESGEFELPKEETPATFLAGVGSQYAPNLQTVAPIEPQHHYNRLIFGPTPINDGDSVYSSPRSTVWQLKNEHTVFSRPVKRSSNESTIGSTTSSGSMVFDIDTLSQSAASLATDDASAASNEASRLLAKRRKSTPSRSASSSSSDVEYHSVDYDAEGNPIPRMMSPRPWLSKSENHGTGQSMERFPNESVPRSIVSRVPPFCFTPSGSTSTDGSGAHFTFASPNEPSVPLPKSQRGACSGSVTSSLHWARDHSVDHGEDTHGMPRLSSPDLGNAALFRETLNRKNHEQETVSHGLETAASTIFDYEAEFSKHCGPKERAPDHDGVTLSLEKLKINEQSRTQKDREDHLSNKAVTATEARHAQPASNCQKLPVPPTTISIVSESTPKSTFDHDTSFSSPAKCQRSTPPTTPGESVSVEESVMDEEDDLVSNFSDIADDESIHQALAASSLSPALFPLFVALKELVIFLADQCLQEWRSRGGGDQPRSSGASGEVHLALPRRTHGGNANQRKRALSNGGSSFDGDGDDDDEEEEERKRQRKDLEQGDSNSVAENGGLACPFQKRNPEKDWYRSYSSPYPQVHRIKEHIGRRHMLPPHCNRCFANFPDDDQRTAHQRAEIACRPATPPDPSEGIDGERLIRLKNRKGLKNKDEKLKWEVMYQVLFPNEEVPAPWCNFEKLKKTFKESGLPQVDAERLTPMMLDVLHEQLRGTDHPADLRESLLSTVKTSMNIVIKKCFELPSSQPGGDNQAVRHVESDAIEPCASERMARGDDDKNDDDDDGNNNDESRNNTDGNSNSNNNDDESQHGTDGSINNNNDESRNNTDGNDNNDDNSDESREYCPHIQGRIPYPNTDCELCIGNWEYDQSWLPDGYTLYEHGEE